VSRAPGGDPDRGEGENRQGGGRSSEVHGANQRGRRAADAGAADEEIMTTTGVDPALWWLIGLIVFDAALILIAAILFKD
jgi:hypothetical protein